MVSVITQGKFHCVCSKCSSQTVNMGISHVTKNDGWGESYTVTRIKFTCIHCDNEWSEDF